VTRLVLGDSEFAQLRGLLVAAAGLVVDDARRESLALSVAERLRATGTPSAVDYLQVVGGDADEQQRLVEEVTIQETHFFRNPPQMRALREHVLPELLRDAAAARRRLRVWSAGCATGEEAYSVAVLLRELAPAASEREVQVLGTDVSHRALEAAREARYGARALQLATPDQLARSFVLAPGGGHHVREQVRALVSLRHHNLVTDAPPYGPGEVDLVLCRNVTIYFGRETTRALVGRFARVLREGGYLLLGHSETLWQVSEDFRLVPLGSGDTAAFVYRRQGPPGGPPERRVARTDRRGVGPRTAPDRRSGAPGGAAAVRGALGRGDYGQAARLAADAVRAEPLRPDLHYLHGLALVDLGRDAEAAVVLRGAVYLAPGDGLAHFLLAGVLARLGDPGAARRVYAAAAHALVATPPDPTATELGGRRAEELARLCRRLADV